MTPTLVIVPGLDGAGPAHWQTHWEETFGALRLHRDAQPATARVWSQGLQQLIEATPGDLVLVGHGAGVLNIVHWAALTGGHGRVRGALLVCPDDADAPGAVAGAPDLLALAPVPTLPLPFPALVVASENDPAIGFARAQALAEAWEAEFISAGEAGHLDAASGHGVWEDGEVLLGEALHAWTPPDIVRL